MMGIFIFGIKFNWRMENVREKIKKIRQGEDKKIDKSELKGTKIDKVE